MSSQSHSASWRLTGFALSAVGAMLFAIKGVLIKLIYAYQVDTTALLAVRMALSLPVFLAVGIVEWRRRPVDRRPNAKSIGLAALVGILGYHLSSWLDFEGLQTLEAQTERLILFTYPFMVLLFGRLLFRHRMRAHALAGAGLSYAGLILMFGADPARLTPAMLGGAALVLCAAAFFALYQLFARELILRCGPALFTAIAMSTASTTLIAQYLLAQGIAIPPAPLPAWSLMAALALFSTVVPTFMMSAGTARIGAQGTAIISTVSPLVTIVLAILILGEPFGWPEAAGTALVVGGVGLFTLIESRRPRA
ncbi:DMT family transporter [Rhizorhabdus dicambivorans]|uniref:EamA family transporter n=1 Tax=Rhizorhabdus dicambivorans TaxID=1850238 RepID=A0A2A4G2T6_9SPHN|nr:DMT family transporter [Rhizorhabdus dicambivorans]ATE65072.1 EamA family transporter [Rhizorhabdus dicambivorans]PCE44346.1 EamA family transporter [Rhizorhabdus dicambivorans]